MKSFLIPILLLVAFCESAYADNTKYVLTAKNILQKYNSKGIVFNDGTKGIIVNGRSIHVDAEGFTSMLNNSLNDCEDLAAYNGRSSDGDLCKSGVMRELEEWAKAAGDKSISTAAWYEGARVAVTSPIPSKAKIYFGVWYRTARMTQAKINRNAN